MIKKQVIAVITAWCFVWVNTLNAQPASDSLNYPRLNRPCPEFMLHNMRGYSKKEATLNDFKGKWLLLSFWNKFCGACVASFPKENRWYQQYADKMQFISVAIQDKEGQIEALFLRYKQRENLGFPVAYDSALAKKWDIYAGPDMILIDPDGIVRERGDMPTKLLDAFIKGRSPRVPPVPKYDFEKDPRIKIDKTRPYLVNGNGGADSNFSYRSLISEFDCTTQMRDGSKDFIEEGRTIEGNEAGERNTLMNGMFQVVGVPLECLYSYGWLGTGSPYWVNQLNPKSIAEKIILNVRDSSLFSFTDCDNRYCYSLKLPVGKANKEKVMRIMQQDLENYFGFTASLEDQTITTWKLIATDKTKLRSKAAKFKEQITTKTEDYSGRNIPWADFYDNISHKGALFNLEITDSTGINGNIDIDMHCSFTLLEDVKKALLANGLQLIPVVGVRKALVIRDMKE